MDNINISKFSREHRESALQELIKVKGNDEGKRALIAIAHRCALRVLPRLGVMPLSFNWPEKPFWQLLAVIRANMVVRQGLNVNLPNKLFDVFLSYVSTAATMAKEVHGAQCANYAIKSARAGDGLHAIYTGAAISSCCEGYPEADSAIEKDYVDLMSDDKTVDEVLTSPLWGEQSPESFEKHSAQFYDELSRNKLDLIAEDVAELLGGSFTSDLVQKYFVNISVAEIQSAKHLYEVLTKHEQTVDNFAVRTLIVGPGGAGKTSLADLIESGTTEKKKPPTVGIEYRNHSSVDLTIHRARLEKDVKRLNPDIYLWDFGGQAIYHSLHHAFMNEKCVYIVVVDSRHEQAPEPWLHQVANFAGPESYVLVVTNWFDDIKTQQNRSALIRKFPGLLDQSSFFEFSCQHSNSEGFTEFINHLVRICCSEGNAMLPDTKRAFELVDSTFKGQKNIVFNKLKGLLTKTFSHYEDDELLVLMHKLKEFGRYIELGDEDRKNHEKLICLDPNLTVKMAYQLVHTQSAQNNGGFIQIDTKDLKYQNVLEFMCKHGVSTRLIHQGYFLPDAAPIDEPPLVKRLLANRNIVTLRYELTYLPIGLNARVATGLIDEGCVLEVKEHVWRDGIIAQLNENGKTGYVIVEYQHHYNAIALYLVGDMSLYANLLAVVDLHIIAGVSVTINKNLMAVDIDGKKNAARQLVKYPILSSQHAFNQGTEIDEINDARMLKQLHQALVKKSGLDILLMVV